MGCRRVQASVSFVLFFYKYQKKNLICFTLIFTIIFNRVFSIMHVFSNELQLFSNTQSIILSTVLFQQIVVGLLFCFVHLSCVCFHKLSYILFLRPAYSYFYFSKIFWGVHGGHLIINKIARGNHVARTKQPNTNQTLVILYTYSIKKKPFFKHTLLNKKVIWHQRNCTFYYRLYYT